MWCGCGEATGKSIFGVDLLSCLTFLKVENQRFFSTLEELHHAVCMHVHK